MKTNAALATRLRNIYFMSVTIRYTPTTKQALGRGLHVIGT